MRKLLLNLFGLLPKRPTGHPPFAFRDLSGVEYFGWDNIQDMPPARVNAIEDVILQIDASMSRANLEAIAMAIASHAGAAMSAKDAKARTEAMQKVSVLANEILIRPTTIIPEDCYMALAAICAVRKDEDPYSFDRAIQAEKMEAFKLAGRAGHAFFTQTGAFRDYVTTARSTESALRDLLVDWISQGQRMEAVLRICGSGSSAKPDMMSSEP